MSLRFWSIVIDSPDPAKIASWWADALGWKVLYEAADGDEVVICTPDERHPGFVFGRVPEAKSVKNRIHLDFVPDDQDAEVARMIGLGASHADVGQRGDEGWIVLADPDGNEFCVLSAREGGM